MAKPKLTQEQIDQQNKEDEKRILDSIAKKNPPVEQPIPLKEQVCSAVDPNKFKKEHIDFINKILRQGGASHSDKEQIYNLYKLYIMPDHKGWTNSNCRSCASSIIKLFDDLKRYINENQNKFIN